MCRIKHCGNNFHIEKKMQGWASSRSQRLLRNRNALHFVYTHRLRVLCGFYSGFIVEKLQLHFMFQVWFFGVFFLKDSKGGWCRELSCTVFSHSVLQFKWRIGKCWHSGGRYCSLARQHHKSPVARSVVWNPFSTDSCRKLVISLKRSPLKYGKKP